MEQKPEQQGASRKWLDSSIPTLQQNSPRGRLEGGITVWRRLPRGWGMLCSAPWWPHFTQVREEHTLRENKGALIPWDHTQTLRQRMILTAISWLDTSELRMR